MLNEQRKQELTELCQSLIRNASYSGHEENVVKAIEENFKKLGFDSWFRDEYGNIIGCIKGNKEGKKILFDGHIDTVEVPDESKWTFPYNNIVWLNSFTYFSSCYSFKYFFMNYTCYI